MIGLPRGQKSKDKGPEEENIRKVQKSLRQLNDSQNILTFVGNIRVYTTCVHSEKEKKDKKDESEAFAKH